MEFLSGVSSGVFVIAGLMALTILFLLAMFARLYRKAGPHEALVVYGFRGTRVVKGHGTVIFPMIETAREGIDGESSGRRRLLTLGPAPGRRDQHRRQQRTVRLRQRGVRPVSGLDRDRGFLAATG